MAVYYIDAHVDPDSFDEDAAEAALATTSPYPMLSAVDGVFSLTAEIDAPTEREALSSFSTAARRAGITVRRYVPDLVNIQEIARRTSVTAEAVRTWAQGTRRTGFPAHALLVSNKPLWHWGDVRTWIRGGKNRKVTVDDLYDYTPLSWESLDRANMQLHREESMATA